mgnify:FL=1
MLSSQEQMEIIKGALAEGYKGPIFKLIEQANFKKQEEAAQQEQPEQRETGGLVQSYKSEPPSLEMLPTGDKVGKYDTLENAGIYKSGGFKKYHKGGPAHTHTDPPKEKFKTGVNSFVSGTPIQDKDLVANKELFLENKPVVGRSDHNENLLSWIIPSDKQQGTGKNTIYYEELANYYKGNQEYPYKYLSKSNYKPNKSKDKNADYMSINSQEFKDNIIKAFNNASVGDSKTGKSTIVNKNEVNARYVEGLDALGRFNIHKGSDEKGEYLSYYDKWDVGPLADKIGKPFEVYDRIYVKENAKQYRKGGFNKKSHGGIHETDPPKYESAVQKQIRENLNAEEYKKYNDKITARNKEANSATSVRDVKIKPTEKVGAFERITDILASPTTAFRYSVKNQPIPDNIPIDNPDRTVIDMVLDTVNPFAMGKYARQVGRDLEQGNKLDAAFNTLGAIPVLPAWAKKAELLNPGKTLKNVGKNLNKEAAATKKIQEQLRKRTTYPTQNSPSPLLPENAPYLSKVINKTPKDEQIFRSFLDARKRLKLEAGDIKHFDPQGNPIINKSGVDGNFLTRPLTPFDKNELTLGKQLYRKIGNKKGLKDLIDKGGAQAPAPMRMNSGATVDTPFFGGGKKPNENYGGLFAVETSMPSKSKYAWSSNVGGTRNYGVAPFDKATGSPVKNIPLDDLEVFRKKWFSNSYKKLDKENLQKELKSANLQEFSEKLYKYGIRGYLADQILNDGDLTGGKAVKLIEENFKNNKETKGDKELLKKQIKKQNGGIVSRKVLYNKVNSKKIKKRKR